MMPLLKLVNNYPDINNTTSTFTITRTSSGTGHHRAHWFIPDPPPRGSL
jgi:hypothetical protein